MIGRIILNTLSNKKPAHMILHVTSRCQLKCKTCFNRDSDISTPDLDINKIKEVSKYISSPIWLEISGGEPFLREDLPEICALFNPSLVSISTNGQNPRKILSVVKRIKDKLKETSTLSIAVSLDSFEKTHDHIRKKNSFSNAVKTLKLLKTIPDIKVKVNTVLCNQNYDLIIPFMRFVRTLSPDFHSIIFLRGTPRDPRFALPSVEELKTIKEDIFKIWDTYSYSIKNPVQRQILKTYQKELFKTSIKVIEKKTQIPDCLAGTKHLVIRSNRDVAFCEMLSRIGNIKQNNLATILKSEAALIQRKEIKAKNCFCYHNCNMLDNFFLNPIQTSSLLIKSLKKAIWTG